VGQLDATARVVVDPDDPGRVLIVGEDRSGFLLAVTQAFAANGVEVMDARLRTRSDGMAIDTFHVRDDRTGDAVTSDRWDRVTADLLAALTDQFVLRPAVKERIRTYRKPHHDPDVIEVRAHQVSRYTAIEVRAPDRVGLLADIVNALHLEGLDIHLAKIDTMGGEARDIFHVRRVRSPIRVEGELEALLGRLRDRLRG
jgi:[protein-PII] uridylyltransferase